MHTPNLLTFAAVLSSAAAQYKGFNTGSTLTDGSAKSQAVFESEFAAAKVLQGTSGFSSARLYTTIQAGTTSTPILAIPAAIAQDTSLLLGLWASGGQADFTNEIAALTSAISTYGTDFTSRVIGISVGSEDLYRTSVIGIAAEAGVGTTPDVLVSYINQLKSALASTALSSAKITHVDTYNAWTNGSNSAVISAVDFLSMDVYPYFQNTMTNSIDQGLSLFNTAYDETVSVAQGKDVWVTETGWPVSGPTENLAVASVANAKTYWDEVGCNTLFGKVNTFWYILQDAIPTLPSPSFGLVGTGSVSQAPLFNLTCPVASASASTAAAAASSTAATSSSVAGAAIVGAVSNSISSSAVVSSSAAAATSSSARAGLGAIASSQASNASSVSKSAATHASSATGKASSVSGAKTSSGTKTSSSATSSATTSSTISTGGGAVKTMSSSIAFVAIVALLANF